MSEQTINKEELQRFYDGVYAKGDIRDNERLYRWILNLLHPEKNKRLLDIGCGSGWLLREAERLSLKTYGIDISCEAVKRAKANAPNSEVSVGDGEKLPWPANYFDYVSSLGSLEHYISPEKGVREIQRILRPDGIAVIMLPNAYQFGEIFKVLFTGRGSEQWQAVERHLTKNQWKEFLEGNGLKVIKILKYNKYPEFFQAGTFKIKSIRKFIATSLIRYLSPFNFSQQFVYICHNVPSQ